MIEARLARDRKDSLGIAAVARIGINQERLVAGVTEERRLAALDVDGIDIDALTGGAAAAATTTYTMSVTYTEVSRAPSYSRCVIPEYLPWWGFAGRHHDLQPAH